MATKAAAIVLTSVQLFGEQREPGDPISQAELDSLSPALCGALQREGVIALGDTLPEISLSDAEQKAGTKVKAARRARDKLAAELADLRKQHQAAAAAVTAKEQERTPLLPAAMRGVVRAKQRAETLLHERQDAEQRLADLGSACSQAERTLAAAEAKLEDAERDRLRAEVDRLAAARIEDCQDIQRLLDELRPCLESYMSRGRQIIRALGSASSAQIDSLWRVESVLDAALGRHVAPDRRAAVADFAALEGRVLDGAIRRAFPDKADRVAA